MKEERKEIGILSKLIVYNCFRNGPIETIHAGKYVEIPPEASRITQEEMALIMSAATTQVAALEKALFLMIPMKTIRSLNFSLNRLLTTVIPIGKKSTI